MTKYHVNSKGEAGLCRATKRCPFGDLTLDHYATPQEARNAYETYAQQYFQQKVENLSTPAVESIEELSDSFILANSAGVSSFSEDGDEMAEQFNQVALQVMREADDDHESALRRLPSAYREALLQEHQFLKWNMEEAYDNWAKKEGMTLDEALRKMPLERSNAKTLLQEARSSETAMAHALLLAQEKGIPLEDWTMSDGPLTLTAYDTPKGRQLQFDKHHWTRPSIKGATPGLQSAFLEKFATQPQVKFAITVE